jgi:hypothetical protein
MRANRNFNVFTDLKPLELEVPIICLATGCVSGRRDRRYTPKGAYTLKGTYETKGTSSRPLFSAVPLAKTPVAGTGYAPQRVTYSAPIFSTV